MFPHRYHKNYECNRSFRREKVRLAITVKDPLLVELAKEIIIY